MVNGVVKKGWRLGLLEGERGNEEKVAIWLTLRWKEHWRKVKEWDYWRVKGAMEKGLKFSWLKGEMNTEEKLMNGLTGGWKGQWRKGEDLGY